MNLKCKISMALICLIFVCKANQENPKWFGNDHFKITYEHNLVKVDMAKMPWETFSVNVKELAVVDGMLSFEVKSDQPIKLRVDGVTANNNQINLFNEEISSGDFESLFYNLSEKESNIDHLIFYVNPGKEHKGEVVFKGLNIAPSFEGEKAISVFPNPASDVIHIQLPSNQFDRVAIYDNYGKVVYDEVAEGKSMDISLSGRPAGVYMVRATGQHSSLTSKIIVK